MEERRAAQIMRADYLQWPTSAISALTIKNLETEQSASLKVINVHGLVFSLCSGLCIVQCAVHTMCVHRSVVCKIRMFYGANVPMCFCCIVLVFVFLCPFLCLSVCVFA